MWAWHFHRNKLDLQSERSLKSVLDAGLPFTACGHSIVMVPVEAVRLVNVNSTVRSLIHSSCLTIDIL